MISQQSSPKACSQIKDWILNVSEIDPIKDFGAGQDASLLGSQDVANLDIIIKGIDIDDVDGRNWIQITR